MISTLLCQRSDSRKEILFHIFYFLCVLFILWNQYNDGDIWWHIAVGNSILNSYSIPSLDEWTYTASGNQVIYHSWLSEIIFSICYRFFGEIGLDLIKYIFHFTSILLVYFFARKKGLNEFLAVLLTLLLSFWLHVRSIRPQIFTPFFCILYFFAINSKISWRKVINITLCTWLWANLHGGFVIGLIILVSGFLGECVDRFCYEKKNNEMRLKFWIAFLSFVISFFNPYCINLYVDIINGVNYPSFDWINIYLWPPNTHWLTLIILVLNMCYMSKCIASAVFGEKKNINLLIQSLIIYFVLVTARRLDWLLFIPTYFLFMGIQSLFITSSNSKLFSKIGILLMIILFLCLKYVSFTKNLMEFPQGFNELFYKEKMRGNMYCPLPWSGKVTLLSSGAIKIYIDGRLGLYPNFLFYDYLHILNKNGMTYGQIVYYDIKYLFIPLSKLDLFILSSTPIQWKPLRVSDSAILLERKY
ncbi:MAG: hypothetical protein JXR73_07865 [Candidatus Omnitrophica bacterium]|nr:hypothetical protein [Candidatus Omnitrophota bacterium]